VVNVVVYQMIASAAVPHRRFIGSCAATIVLLFGLPFLYGWNAINRLMTAETVRVAVLQGTSTHFTNGTPPMSISRSPYTKLRCARLPQAALN